MTFSEVLASLRSDGDAFTVRVDETWAQGRATFGGLVAAAGNEALRRLVPRDRPLRSLQTTFVAPASQGTWRLETRVLRVGKAVTLAHCDVLDGEQVAATIVGVYGMPRPSAVRARPQPLMAQRKVDEVRDVRYQEGLSPTFAQHFGIRWAEGLKPFTASPQTPTKAYIRHLDRTPLTESHVIALVDCIPTPALSMFTAPAQASSLVWTLEFFEHRFDFPPDAWWRIDSDLDAASDGYVNQTSVLNDPTATPVALSRQLFAVFG
jgi:acyl-CoA thioesterase